MHVHSSTSAGDMQILQIESLAVVYESSCLSGSVCCWSSPCCCLHHVRLLIPGTCLNFTKRANSDSLCWLQAEGCWSKLSRTSCLWRALCIPSLRIQYLCCRGLHQSNSFLCSILWHALSNGEPTYSQPQESSTEQRTLWIWWLRISCPYSGCLRVQKIFHC